MENTTAPEIGDRRSQKGFLLLGNDLIRNKIPNGDYVFILFPPTTTMRLRTRKTGRKEIFLKVSVAHVMNIYIKSKSKEQVSASWFSTSSKKI